MLRGPRRTIATRAINRPSQIGRKPPARGRGAASRGSIAGSGGPLPRRASVL